MPLHPTAVRILPYAVAAVVVAAGLTGAAQLLWHAQVFAGRAGFPLDLEWMEGGVLVHARRLADGQALYVKPSLDFIPFLYTPFYPALLAGLSKIAPLGYTLGRVVSIVSFVGALALLVIAALRESTGASRWGRAVAALVGVAGAGLVAGSFEVTGSFYDLARADSLLLLLEAGALAAAWWGRTPVSAAGAAVLMTLAFLTKQTGPVVGVGIGIGLLYLSWRRGLVYGAIAAALMGLALLYLVKSSDGWFWTYVYKLHQSHPFRFDTLAGTPPFFWKNFRWLLIALGLATGGLALAGRLRRSDAILWGGALAGIASGVLGFATMWAWANAYVPAIYFPALAATVLGTRLALHAIESRKVGAIAVAISCAAAIGAQSLSFGKPDAKLRVPQPADRAAAARFLERLRGLPGDGFIPFHPFYSVLARKRPFVHRMGVMDVATLGRPEGLDQAVLEQRFPWIILDYKSMPDEWPWLNHRYRVVHEFREGTDSVRMFAGADTSPRWLLHPTLDPPPLPVGARRLFDFESGRWDGWSSAGAFGSAPFSARSGLFGRFAADSARFGPAGTGTLRSPPFRLDRPHLRFVLSGPADPGLRVVLLDGSQTARSASPGGGTTPVDWAVADLVGREVVLQLEDRSAVGGFALDEVVAH